MYFRNKTVHQLLYIHRKMLTWSWTSNVAHPSCITSGEEGWWIKIDRTLPPFRQTLCHTPFYSVWIRSVTEEHHMGPPSCLLYTFSRENWGCSGWRLVTLTPETETSIDVHRINAAKVTCAALLTSHAAAAHPFCCTAPAAIQ